MKAALRNRFWPALGLAGALAVQNAAGAVVVHGEKVTVCAAGGRGPRWNTRRGSGAGSQRSRA